MNIDECKEPDVVKTKVPVEAYCVDDNHAHLFPAGTLGTIVDDYKRDRQACIEFMLHDTGYADDGYLAYSVSYDDLELVWQAGIRKTTED